MCSPIKIGIIALVFSLAAGRLQAQKPVVGEVPPPITIDQWLSAQPDTYHKPILLEFWATWCPPCRASIPHLNQIYEKYKNTDLIIIGVSDENADIIKNFQKTTPMKYPNGISKDLVQKYCALDVPGAIGIPQAFLIGKDGRLIWSGHPMKLTDKELKKAL